MNKMSLTLRVEKASTRNWGHLTPISLIFFVLLFSTSVQAQIENMYSLYRFNPQILTPVQAGSTPNSEMILMYRNQWVGIEGAPRNLGFSGNFKWGQKKGLGFTALLDEAGPVRSTLLGADFAYHVKLNENWNLDGGIRMGMANIALNFSQIRLVNSNDNLFAGDRSTGIQPNLGYGIRIAKKDEGFFFSFSQPRVLKYDFGNYSGAFRDVAYYYAMAGTKIGLGGKVETPNGLRSRVTLYPSVLVRLAADVPLSYDLNLTANLKGKLDVGLSYRRQDSYGLRLGVQATKKIYLGYVFELPISEIRKASSQTHEMAIRFFIFDKKKEEKKDELKIEETERRIKDFGPYNKKEQAEPSQPVQKILPETTQKMDAQEIKNVEASKPAQAPAQQPSNQEVPKAPASQAQAQTPAQPLAAASDEEEFEYVTVTKTRVVRTRPKVTNKTVTSTQRTQGAVKQVATSTIKARTQAKANVATAANKTAANTAKPAVKQKPAMKKPAVKKPAQVAATNTAPVVEDPNAPKVTRKRISNNITETTVEKKGGSESQVGADGNQKVTKRKRKDGTEETIYTTTEVVKKKKEK
jgi:type IX secretion system PorP/SprF family membrane protein